MSIGETAREQSPQKVSSTFLLKLALSCVCNSIFKPAACQSHCAELPAHASGFGALCRGRGGCKRHPEAWARCPVHGARPAPTLLVQSCTGARVCSSYVLPPGGERGLLALVLASGDRTSAGQTDTDTSTDAGTCRRDEGRQVERRVLREKTKEKAARE